MNILVTMPAGEKRDTFITEFSMERLQSLGNVTLNPYERDYTTDELKEALKGIDIVFCCVYGRIGDTHGGLCNHACFFCPID